MRDTDKILVQQTKDNIDRAKANMESKLHRQPRWSNRDLMKIAKAGDSIYWLARQELINEQKLWFDYDAGFWRPGKGVPGGGNIVGPIEEI